MRNQPNTSPSATAPATMIAGMRKTTSATSTAATKEKIAAFQAAVRRTARKKNSVHTGMAAASVESSVFPSGSKFCSQG